MCGITLSYTISSFILPVALCDDMSFLWNAYSPLHIVLDGLTIVVFAIFFFLSRRKGDWIALSSGCFAAFLAGSLLGFPVWGVFFEARLLWIIATVALPFGMICLWLRKRQLWWLLGALLLLSFKFYGEAVEPRRLEVTKLTVRSAKVRHPLRITHISDIQTDGLNEMYWSARKASDAFDPHLVLFTGDLVNHESLLPEVEKYLQSFKNRNGAFLVGGNCDRGISLEDVARNSGFQDIEGRSARLQVEGDPILLAGLDGGAHLNYGAFSFSGLNQEINPADLVLLLSHYPDAAFALQNEPVDVLFSGHTHGGQACLPLLGPVITFSRVPRLVAAGGLHKLGNVSMVVSRGLGWEGHVAPRVRLLCRPQIILLEIVPK
jgi:uncharacterized protein